MCAFLDGAAWSGAHYINKLCVFLTILLLEMLNMVYVLGYLNRWFEIKRIAFLFS